MKQLQILTAQDREMLQKRKAKFKKIGKRKNGKSGIAFLLSSVLIFSLTSCSYLPDWLGESKKNSGIKGTRISVLHLDNSNTSADNNLAELKVLIPRSTPNDKWYKSNGTPSLLINNPYVPHEFPVKYEVGIGGSTTDGEHMTASPLVADGKIFVIAASGKVSAFDALNIRKPIWRTKLKFDNKREKLASAAGMTYYEGKIYIATGYNQVDALDSATGKVIWTRTINSIARSAPEVKNNVIYINTIDNRLYALDTADGGILWTHTGGNEDISVFGSASPVVYENMVIAPYSSGEVYALKISDGTEIWSDVFARRSISSAGTLSDIDASPVVQNGKVFIISNDGVLAASDLKTGKRIWEQAVSGRQSPWIAGDFLYLISNKNEITCINTSSGGIKWVKQLQSYKKEDSKSNPIKWSGPVLAGDLLWVVSSHGKIMALSPRNGDIEYERKVPKDIYISPVVAYGNIYLYSDDAELIELTDKTVFELNDEKLLTEDTQPVVETKPNPGKIKPLLNKITSGVNNTTRKVTDSVKGLFGDKKVKDAK